jgi:hypothetical protein
MRFQHAVLRKRGVKAYSYKNSDVVVCGKEQTVGYLSLFVIKRRILYMHNRNCNGILILAQT